MPKIIENVREKLIETTREQIKKYGYAGTTIRSVAKECSLGVGTVYNYFESKEKLVHAYMYKDWLTAKEQILLCSERTDDPREILICIHTVLYEYMTEHRCLFADPHASKVFADYYVKGHVFLRNQLAEILMEACNKHAKSPSELLPAFLAEEMLVWTAAGLPFENIYALQKVHFK